MGIFTSCCKPSAAEVVDVETRRMQQRAAAEKRRIEEESKGIKNPERVKRMQARAEEAERKGRETLDQGGPTLKWTTK